MRVSNTTLPYPVNLYKDVFIGYGKKASEENIREVLKPIIPEDAEETVQLIYDDFELCHFRAPAENVAVYRKIIELHYQQGKDEHEVAEACGLPIEKYRRLLQNMFHIFRHPVMYYLLRDGKTEYEKLVGTSMEKYFETKAQLYSANNDDAKPAQKPPAGGKIEDCTLENCRSWFEPRDYNSLRRNGLNTIGDVVNAWNIKDKLLGCKNIGKSAQERIARILRENFKIELE